MQPVIEQMAFELEKTKKHWPVLRSIRAIINVLKPTIFAGYRIAVRGKIQRSRRTRTFYIKEGFFPISTFATRMSYSLAQAKARTGAFGISS